MGTNYNRGILKQDEELTLGNERLTKENEVLRAENKVLREQIAQMSETILKLMVEIERLKPTFGSLTEKPRELGSKISSYKFMRPLRMEDCRSPSHFAKNRS